MLAFLLFQVPAQNTQVQAQVGTALPPNMEALLKAKDWAGLADHFESASPAIRRNYYEYWLQSLNRCQRWERLLTICEALQPLLEAKTGPQLATYRLNRALALSQLGRHSEAALAHAENGRLGRPDGFPNACAEAGLAQDWSTMLTFSEEILKRKPEDAAGLGGKGESLARLNRLPEAEPFLRAAVERNPKSTFVWNNLGRCLNEKKAWAEACDCLDKALALEPNQFEALFNRGRAQFELKRYKESRDDFRAALALSPDDYVIAENLRQAERYAALPAPKPTTAPKKK